MTPRPLLAQPAIRSHWLALSCPVDRIRERIRRQVDGGTHVRLSRIAQPGIDVLLSESDRTRLYLAPYQQIYDFTVMAGWPAEAVK